MSFIYAIKLQVQRLRGLDKTELSKLLSILFDQGFTSLVSFLTTVVLSRVLVMEDYAVFVLLMSITITILGFQRALITQPYVINHNDFNTEEVKSYFHANIIYKLLFTLLFVVFVPAIIWFKESTKVLDLTLLLTFFIIFYSSFYFIKDMLLSNRETLLNLKYSLFSNIFLVIILAFIYINKANNLSFYLLGGCIIYGLAYLFYNWKNRAFLKLDLSTLLPYFKLNWKVGKWIAGSNLFFTISSQIYPWLLLWYMSKNEIAIYGVLISISSLVNPVLVSLRAYLLPIFSKISYSKEKLMILLKKWMVVFFTLALLLVAIGILFGENIIELFFGSKYSGLGILFVLPFVDQAINIFFQPIDVALNAIKRTDVGFQMLLFRSICALILGFILVQEYGLIGVFITRILENILYQLGLFIYFKKIMKV